MTYSNDKSISKSNQTEIVLLFSNRVIKVELGIPKTLLITL